MRGAAGRPAAPSPPRRELRPGAVRAPCGAEAGARRRCTLKEWARASDVGHVKPASTTASVARRLLPYGATTLLAFVLVAIDDQRRPGELVAGGVLACLVFGLVAMPARTPFPRAEIGRAHV